MSTHILSELKKIQIIFIIPTGSNELMTCDRTKQGGCNYRKYQNIKISDMDFFHAKFQAPIAINMT
jgi:hypothetical protein